MTLQSGMTSRSVANDSDCGVDLVGGDVGRGADAVEALL